MTLPMGNAAGDGAAQSSDLEALVSAKQAAKRAELRLREAIDSLQDNGFSAEVIGYVP